MTGSLANIHAQLNIIELNKKNKPRQAYNNTMKISIVNVDMKVK